MRLIMTDKLYKPVRKVLPFLVVAITVFFFARALGRNWGEVQQISFTPNLASAIGVICFMASVIVSGILWSGILNKLVTSKHIGWVDGVRIHTASWLLKYIPGQAGSYLNKLAWGVKNGYSKKALTNSFIYENALLLFASIIISVPVVIAVLSSRFSENLTLFAPLLVAVPLVLVLHQNTFYKVTNFIFKKLKNQTISKDLFLRTEQIAFLQLEFLLPRILTGVGFVWIASSLVYVAPSDYVPLAVIYILAGVVGLLAIFVPSGLGVREAVIVLLASAYMTPAQAVVVSIAARFYATIADLLLAGVYLVLNKGRINQQ
jgi:uncharacterized membrane protein YbhN (UPF0104 family)